MQFQVLTWQPTKEQEVTRGCVMELTLYKTWLWMHRYRNKLNLFQVAKFPFPRLNLIIL